MNTVNQLTVVNKPNTRSRKKSVYFPDDVWKIIKEYNGIVGWEKPIIDLFNKPSLLKLCKILEQWFYKQYINVMGMGVSILSNYWRTKSKKRIFRKKLIQRILKTNPNHTELIECWNARAE